MCTSVAVESHPRHTLWRLLREIRPRMCKYSAEGPAPSIHTAVGGQPQGSRLASCTHAAAEAWAGGGVGFRLQHGEVISECEGDRGVKIGEICRGSTATLPAIGLFSGKSCQGPLQSRTLGNTVDSAVWLILVAPGLLH